MENSSEDKTFTMEELLLKMKEANKAYAKAVISGGKWDYSEWMKKNLNNGKERK